MNRPSRWLWLACCTLLLSCRPGSVRLEGEVVAEGARLGFVDVLLVPEPSMKEVIEERARRGKPFFSEDPTAKYSVKTDHEGNFFLDVPAGRYAVFARASLGTGAQKRDYRWLLWRTVEPDGGRLTLSNDNLAGSGCADCIPIAPVLPEIVVPSTYADPVVTLPPASQMVVMGALDRELVHRVIKANRGQVRYCYESLLMQNPTLGGAVTVKFVIAPTGKVANAAIAQSTVANSQLESCLAGRVRTWTFPKPKGGGVVVVSYPFRFAHEGG